MNDQKVKYNWKMTLKVPEVEAICINFIL